MGGGDLNLKKSWHPSTLRNIERVWKAEQKHEVERQKIEQLQKELAEERAREEIQAFAEDQGVVRKKEERLEWMYQGPAAMVNRDEYLLGRKIDKTFETLQQIENGGEAPKNEDADGPSMFSSQDLSGTATVDLANKIREDPLFNIMKKEKEERKNLLTNPVKMKQLQQMLKASLGGQKSKKSKKSKKKKYQGSDSEEEKEKKKHRKHKKSVSSESDDEREGLKQTKKSDNLKHKMLDKDFSIGRKRPMYNSVDPFVDDKCQSASYYASSEKESNYGCKASRSAPDSRDHHTSREPNHGLIGQSSHYTPQESNHHSSRESSHYSSRESNHHSSRESSHYSSRESNHYSSRESNHHSSIESSHYSSRESNHQLFRESNHYSSRVSAHHSSRESNHYSSRVSDHHSSRESNDYSSREASHRSSREYKSKSYDSRNHSSQEDRPNEEKKRKLNEEERQRLLQEMQENARWRDEQRKRNTQRYKEEEERENNANKMDTSDFLKPMLSKAASKSSLENRVKQKIFTIQRRSADMDKNFARRD